MDCREHCHENHHDHLEHHLCHHGEGHHLFVLVEIEEVAAGNRTAVDVDGWQEEGPVEVEEEEGS